MTTPDPKKGSDWKRRVRQIAPFFVAFLALGALFYLFRGDLEKIEELSLEAPHWLVVATALIVFFFFVRRQVNARILAAFEVLPNEKENFFLALVTRLGNYITPTRGGAVARAVYLKKRYELPYTAFVSQLGATYVITLFISSSLGALSSVYIGHAQGVTIWPLLLFFSAVSLTQLALISFSQKLKEVDNRLVNKIIRVVNNWHVIRKNKRLVWSISIIATVQCATTAAILFCLYRSFGVGLTYIHALFLMAITSITMVLSFTPAGLGIYEMILVFMGEAIGIGAAETFTVALLMRGLNIAMLAVLGPVGVYYLTRQLAAMSPQTDPRDVTLFRDDQPSHEEAGEAPDNRHEDAPEAHKQRPPSPSNHGKDVGGKAG